jgi:YggT family protein
VSPIIGIIQSVLVLLELLIIARFIAQLFDATGRNPITRTLIDVTEPILAPVRRLMPPTGGIDFSPTVVLLLLFVLQRVLS